MFATRATVDVTTDASGDATVHSPILTGRLIDIQYVADGTSPFDNTADFTITGDTTGKTLLTQSNVSAAFTKAPRQPVHDTAGVASLYAAAGEPVEDHIVLAEERVKIVVAQGGNTKSGRFYITVA